MNSADFRESLSEICGLLVQKRMWVQPSPFPARKSRSKGCLGVCVGHWRMTGLILNPATEWRFVRYCLTI